ncbi:MAG: hypothetical protein HY791_37165 [Deltaproteobacteria bacterium]|nr:hypothetical protein [Deltaproteobacteria bacterium]
MFLGGVFLALNSIEDHKDKDEAAENAEASAEDAVLKASQLSPQHRSLHAANPRRPPERPEARAEAPKPQKPKDDAVAQGERARADLGRRGQQMTAADREIAARLSTKVTTTDE